MKREELKNMELSDEAVDQIMVLHGKDIEKFKADAKLKENELKTLNTQLEEANQAIESFKELDVDGIKSAADEWKQKAEQTKLESEEAIQKMKFGYALDKAITASKAKNAKAVKALLNFDDLKLSKETETIIGLDDQLKKILEEQDYLFESDEPITPNPKIVTGGDNTGILSDAAVVAAREAAGLSIEE